MANRSAPLAIDPFIEDPGNERTMGHRRWLLSEKIHRIGLGSTSRYTCALVDGREWDAEATPRSSGEDAEAVDPRAVETGAAPEVDAQEDAGEARAIADVQPVEKRAADGGPDWVAWPPPGPVPIDALRRTRVDVTGWTIQSSSLDLDDAKIDVRVDGFTRPIVVRALERTTGSLTAIRFLPKGWSTEPDRRYDVHLEKGDTVIDFTVEPIHCP